MTRPTQASPRLPRQSLPLLLLILAVLAFAAYFTWLTLTRFHAFESRALDMGNLNQAIWNTAYGDWFRQTNQPGVTNRLSLHVEPILLPIALLYRLWPGPELLLVLQAFVVACGAIPLFALGKRETGSAWLALLFGLAWLGMPAIQAANWLEFHPVTLAPTFLMAAFYFMVARRPGLYGLFAVLAAASKEDIGLLVFMLGLYALVARKQRRLGLLSMGLGLGWSLFAVLVVQGSFGGNIHWGRYAYLGDGPGAMVRTLVTQPGLLIDQLRKANAPGYLYELLLPVGFLALLAPEVLLLALPSLGINLLADFAPMHEVDGLIYAAPIAPFVALAAVMGTARLLRWLRRDEAGSTPLRAAPWLAGALLLISLAAAQWQYGYFPGGANFRRYTVSDHDRLASELVRRIPAGAAVSAQDKLNPHTSGRHTSYIFPRVLDAEVGDADTVFVDVTGPSWPQHPNDVHTTIQDLLRGGWGVVEGVDGFLLLSRGAQNQEIPQAFFTPWHASGGVQPPIAQEARFGNLELLGLGIADDEHGEVVVSSYWRLAASTPEALTIHLTYLDADDRPLFDSSVSPPVISLWYPTTEWPLGETMVVSSLPWPVPAGRFTLLLGVAKSADPSQRIVASEVRPLRPLPEGGNVLRAGGFERSGGRWQAQPPLEPLPATLDARFEDTIALEAAAVALPASGTPTATVTLQWRAQSVPSRDDSIYIHLLDAAGAKVAQWDGPPRDSFGTLPMTAWLPGEPVTGRYPLMLPAGLPAGSYRLLAGLYDWRAGRSVPASGGSSLDGGAAEALTLVLE